MRQRTAVITFLVLVAVMIGMYGLLFLPENAYSAMIDEERPVESIGALALLASSILFFLAFRHTPRTDDRAGTVRRLILAALAVVFLVGFGEEISWGQRLLGIGTPAEVESASHQGELNFHNLNALHGWYDVDRLFQLFWFMFGVLVPLSVALYAPARRLLGRYLPVVPLTAAAALVVNQLLHDIAKAVFDGHYANSQFPLSHSLFETKESLVSLCFAVAALVLYRQAKAASDGVRTARDEPWPSFAGGTGPVAEPERMPVHSSV